MLREPVKFTAVSPARVMMLFIIFTSSPADSIAAIPESSSIRLPSTVTSSLSTIIPFETSLIMLFSITAPLTEVLIPQKTLEMVLFAMRFPDPATSPSR